MPEIISAFDQMKLGNPLEFYDAVITAGTAYGKGQPGTLGELCAKPHPWLYREIGQVALGITEEESDRVVVLEDSSAGVMSGRLAGYPVIAMQGGNVKEAGLMPLTTLYSEDLLEVLKYLIGS
jgi:beta-phosphoglucomutase-like phosphatase (HAD superfamily)